MQIYEQINCLWKKLVVSEKNPTESLLDKGFKTTISKINKTLKMLRELKDVEKVKKTMHKQNGNMKKEKT